MLFIAMLIATTIAIAGSAAYFSVYGLAYTFSGMFWYVVVMGASLEAGKLMSASYLYRYWSKMGGWTWLRYYMIAGILALMFLTSAGIFGFLSSGYQADVLPLKQKEAQVKLLEDEKVRKLARKQQIDDLIARSPIVQNLERNGEIDRRAMLVLRESTRARDSLTRQYKAEQTEVTKRLNELDKEILALQQEIIKTEAHIGPITYIAKAFGYETDQATKYLIFIIIFAFDPMAIALTLRVNIALRVRNNERRPMPEIKPRESMLPEPKHTPPMPEIKQHPKQEIDPREFIGELLPEPKHTPPMPEIEQPHAVRAEILPVKIPISEPVVEKKPEQPVEKRIRPRYIDELAASSGAINPDALYELISYYRELKAKPHPLTGQDLVDKHAIENILRSHGLMLYFNE